MMKTRWKTVLCALWVAGAAWALAGCEDEADNWAFRNESSRRVYVAPNGQNWPAATIGPGGSVEVDYNGDSIQYVYTPSDEVRPEKGKGRVVVFYDR